MIHFRGLREKERSGRMAVGKLLAKAHQWSVYERQRGIANDDKQAVWHESYEIDGHEQCRAVRLNCAKRALKKWNESSQAEDGFPKG